MKDDMGSHYSVLEEDHDMVEGRVEPAVNCESQGVRLLSREKELARNLIASEIVIVEDSHGATKEMSRTAFGIKEGLASGLEKNDVGNSSSVRNSTTCHNLIIEVSDVPSTGKLVKEPSVLNADKHTAVRVDIMGEGRETRSLKGRVLPASIRGVSNASSSKVQLGVRGVSKPGAKVHKRDDQGKLKLALGKRLSSLAADLDLAVVEEEVRAMSNSKSNTVIVNQVEWQTNLMFEKLNASNMQV
ncbi:hypothetical protein V6N12_049522 [Hibiscus sabdariffa]